MTIRTGEVLAGALPKRALRLGSEWAETYRSELLADWEMAREGKPLNAAPDVTRSAPSRIPMADVLRIADADALGGRVLRLTFSTGEVCDVDVLPLVEGIGGPVFAPLRDPAYFARVSVDAVCGTVVWPNGADLAPTALYQLEETGAVPAAG